MLMYLLNMRIVLKIPLEPICVKFLTRKLIPFKMTNVEFRIFCFYRFSGGHWSEVLYSKILFIILMHGHLIYTINVPFANKLSVFRLCIIPVNNLVGKDDKVKNSNDQKYDQPNQYPGKCVARSYRDMIPFNI